MPEDARGEGRAHCHDARPAVATRRRETSPGSVPRPHPSTEAILRYFAYEHLPPALQEVSRPFAELALDMATRLEGPELTAGLRKLLEAKDCMVRAALA